ncbi:leucine-rich repeat-containing protein 36 [Discoglossus pictus]
MALRQVHLDETWVCGKASVPLGKAGSVETLTLQGTYEEKILTLGDAFKNFKSLRSLDLSRNLLVSLKGIEYLHALQFLNLYYNNIASLEQILRLSCLTQIKRLDLRLNPVTRQESDYRLFVINTLATLETLDDRAVRESERHAAKFHFKIKEFEAGQITEKEQKSAAKTIALEKRLFSKPDSDLETTESSKSDPKSEAEDFIKGNSSPFKTMLQDNQPHAQGHNDVDDEDYRQLPSPTRSSLRSPGKVSSIRSKDGFRVTFADKDFHDFSVKDNFAESLESGDLVPSRKLLYSNTDKLRDTSLRNFKNAYHTSDRLTEGNYARNEREKEDHHSLDILEQHSEDLKDLQKPRYKDEESGNDRLLRLSSDLYFTTHHQDPALSSNYMSTLRKPFSDVSKTYALPSKSTFSKSNLSSTKTSQPDFNRDIKKTWNPDPVVTRESLLGPRTGMKRTSSLNSLMSPKPVDIHSDRSTDDSLVGSKYNEPVSLSGLEVTSISDVLQKLMDLVDRYWNGSGSLLQNQRFLVPARELLTNLTTSNLDKELRNKMGDFRTRREPTEDYDNVESLKQQLLKVMEENHFLQSKVSKLERNAAAKQADVLPVLQGAELCQKFETLSVQVESLQQQLKQTHKMHETMNLMHESQRSLVSTNEYLLQQLNLVPPAEAFKALHGSSKPINTTDKYFEARELSPSSPTPGSGREKRENLLTERQLLDLKGW